MSRRMIKTANSEDAQTPAEEHGSLALAACACMLLAAFTNCSLVGAVFLAAFGVWGAICAVDARRGGSDRHNTSDHPRSSLRSRVATGLWSFVAGLAAVTFVAQVALQAAYRVGHMARAEDKTARLILQLLGFPRVRNGWEFALAFVPFLLCLITAVVEANSARRRRQNGGSNLASHPALDQMDGPLRATYALAWAAGYTSSGVLAGLCATTAVVSHPALPGLPLMLGILACLWRWARRQPGVLRPGLLLTGQLWTGLWVAAIYLWQVALLRPHLFHRVAAWCGLYVISHDASLSTTIPQLLHLTSLVVLFAALGCYSGSMAGAGGGRDLTARLPARPVPRVQSRSQAPRDWVPGSPQSSEEGLWWGGPLQMPSNKAVPLQSFAEDQDEAGSGRSESSLLHARSNDSSDAQYDDDQGHLGYRATQWASMVIEAAAGTVVQMVEAFTSRPGVTCVALVAFALLKPSVAAAAMLLVGLWALLLPAVVGEGPFVAAASVLTAAVAIWALSAFCAAAVAPVVALPPLWQSLGLYSGSHAGAAQWSGALAGLLAMVVALAGLSRSRLQQPAIISDEEAPSSPTAGPRQWDRFQAAMNLVASPSKSPRATHLTSGSSLEGSVEQPLLSEEGHVGSAMSAASEDHHGALAAVVLGLARSAWLAGWLLVPCAVFWAGTCRWDGGHVVYLLLLLLQLLGGTLRLQPQATSAVLPVARWKLLRTFSGLHLAAMYIARSAALPGIRLDSWAVRHWPNGDLRKGLEAAGLWRPSPLTAMLPVFVAALLASVHSSLGRWLEGVDSEARDTASAAAGRPQPLFSARAVSSPLQWLGRVAVTLGSLAVVVLAYLLLLWDTPVSLVGLSYLLVAAALFVAPPREGRYVLRDSHIGHFSDFLPDLATEALHQQRLYVGPRDRIVMLGSGRGRWLIAALLAVLCAVDIVVHYTFAATSLPSALALSHPQERFLHEVVGISLTTSHPSLALQLGRGFGILAALTLYRFFFAVGTLSKQRLAGNVTAQEAASRRLEQQSTFAAFLKRAVILHGGKLIALVAWWAAAQRPGFIGWVYVVGLVVCAPLFGIPSSQGPVSQAAFSTLLAITNVLTIAWVVAQYSFQVTWLRHFLGTGTVRWLTWAGLRVAANSGAALERLLRLKFLLLFVVTLKRQSSLWLDRLPPELKEAAGPGAPCLLFWPDAATGAAAASDPATEGFLSRLRASAPVRLLRLALQDVSQRIQASANKVLAAVDWAVPEPEEAPTTEAPAEASVGGGSSAGSLVPHSRGSTADTSSKANNEPDTGTVGGLLSRRRRGSRPGSAESQRGGETLAKWSSQLAIFRFVAQDWAEHLWQDWGMELCMAALLVAAFLSINALSLVFLAAVGIGMAASEGTRRVMWRLLVLPVLGLVLLEQYSLLVGLPPGIHWSLLGSFLGTIGLPRNHVYGLSWALADGNLGAIVTTRHAHSAAYDFKAWAGLEHVSRLALWALFFAWAISVVQVHWAAFNPPRNEEPITNDMLPGLYQPPSSGTAELPPINAASGDSATAAAEEGRSMPSSRVPQANGVPQLWAPLTYEAMPTWRWVDWTRYLFYRHYPDCVLIAVVALCTLENDVIHAGYLALALLFFRRREALRKHTNRLFRWLPVYNYVVMAAILLYQAPFERFFGPWANHLESKVCSVAHLVGLYKMGGGGSRQVLTLSARGAIADMALWGISRVLTRIFASRPYHQAMVVLRAEVLAEDQAAAEERKAARQRQEDAVVAASQLRRTRAHRVRRLKVGVSRREGDAYNVDPMLLDFGSDDNMDLSDPSVSDGPADSGDGDKAAKSSTLTQTKSTADLVRQEEKSRGRIPSQTDLERGVLEFSAAAAEAVKSGTMSARGPAKDGPAKSGDSPWKLFRKLFAPLDRSWVVYIGFVLVFLCDVSLLTLAYPVTLVAYALLSQAPQRAYWLAMLVYTEAILIAQYVWQIPTRLNCLWITPVLRARMEQVGLHGDALRCIPLFIIYLLVLTHTLSVSEDEEATAEGDGGESPVRRSSLEGRAPTRQGHRSDQVDWLHRAIDATAAGALAVFEFYARVTTSSERPLFFVLLDVGPPSGNGSWEGSSGCRALQRSVQHIVDSYRAIDIAAAKARRKARAAEVTPGSTSGGGGLIDLPGDSKVTPRHVDLSDVGPLQVEVCQVRPREQDNVSAVIEVIACRSTASNTAGYSPVAGWPLRSLRPAQHVAETLLRFRAETEQRGTDTGGVHPPADRMVSATSGMGTHHVVTSEDTDGAPSLSLDRQKSEQARRQTSQDGAPPSPAMTTPARRASSLRRLRSEQTALPKEKPVVQADLKVQAAEHHAHREADWYVLTVTADVVAFLYVALFYQAVLQSARSLADLKVQQVIPADYLMTLMALFLAIVLDRVCYTMGNHLAKASLLAVQLVSVYWNVMSLFWSPGQTSNAARMHLRVFAGLKSLSFVFSALQLRSGYPPPASYQGGRGRHSYVFTRSTSTASWLGFQLFAAVPFLYELREILDWSSTPTTLRLFDWIKLQDIGISLYFVTYNRLGRASIPLGQRIPRYQKILQGAVMFVGLLILLWVPLLVFSTGNPTFQTPGIQAFVSNMTISGGAASSHGHRQSQLTFPLWRAGGQRIVGDALINGTLPAALVGQWTADQFRLMCLAEDSDEAWLASPPFKAALREALLTEDAFVEIGWQVERTAPPPSPHGGPLCDGVQRVPLAGHSRLQLLQVLNGTRDSASLMVLNETNPHGRELHARGSPALYGLLWRFSGDSCAVTPDVASLAHGISDAGWGQLHVACDVSLPSAKSMHVGGLPHVGDMVHVGGGPQWWRLRCSVINSDASEPNADKTKLQDCPRRSRGPRLVAILERVQAGLLGQTVSAFGITGLYITFVLSAGRFLRLAVGNMRMRIPYDDLPNTSRLIALCQDIAIARAEGEHALEEELYWAIINIYRRPSVLYEMTKTKLS